MSSPFIFRFQVGAIEVCLPSMSVRSFPLRRLIQSADRGVVANSDTRIAQSQMVSYWLHKDGNISPAESPLPHTIVSNRAVLEKRTLSLGNEDLNMGLCAFSQNVIWHSAIFRQRVQGFWRREPWTGDRNGQLCF